MTPTLTLRRALPADLAAVDRLLSRSYPRLLAPDYPPSAMVLAVPIISRARPELLASGRYFVAEDAAGRIQAAGGWSARTPHGETAADKMIGTVGHVRHVATDPDAVRQGIGRRLVTVVMRDAARAGIGWLDCLSTRTAVPFYAALGFRMVHPVDITLAPGILFPAVRMIADLSSVPSGNEKGRSDDRPFPQDVVASYSRFPMN
ncbi:MAG: GNAT family N-acetyltransferase [Tabrizicola sp.]|nr:GNAT family N-acetyltransferase [Tabrizicola sp.]